MKIGIICAMPEEIRVLQETLQKSESETYNGTTFITGRLGDHEVVIVESGIGKVLAGATAALLLSHFQVEVLINSGSAGGIGTGLAVGDVIISTELAYFDVDVTAFGYRLGQMAGMPEFYQADGPLVEIARKVATKQGLSHQSGLIVTGDTFVNSSSQIEKIKQMYPQALATEMEGAAIAQVAYQATVPFIVIRALSDVADEEASQSFDTFILQAGQKSAELVIGLITEV